MAQVHGSSAITLIPFDGCKKNCTRNEEAEVKPGEVCKYKFLTFHFRTCMIFLQFVFEWACQVF